MLTYNITLSFVFILIVLAYVTSANKRIVSVSFSIASILILSALSAFRDYTVGFDFMYYCYAHIQKANASDNLLTCIDSIKEGPIYSSLLYFVSRFDSNPRWTMFALTLVTFSFAYVGCYNLRRYLPVWLSFSLYIALYYIGSYNLIRQSAAVGVSLYAYSLYKGKYGGRNFYLASFLAVGFHLSAVILPLITIVSNIVASMPDKKRKFFIIVTIIMCIIGVVALAYIINILASIHPAFAKYLSYTSVYGSEKPQFPKTQMLFLLICLLLIVVSLRRKELDLKDVYIFLIFCLADIAFSFLGQYTSSALRICLYLTHICYFGAFFMILKSTWISKQTIQVLFIFLFISMIGLLYLKKGMSDDYLFYKSELLGI